MFGEVVCWRYLSLQNLCKNSNIIYPSKVSPFTICLPFIQLTGRSRATASGLRSKWLQLPVSQCGAMKVVSLFCAATAALIRLIVTVPSELRREGLGCQRSRTPNILFRIRLRACPRVTVGVYGLPYVYALNLNFFVPTDGWRWYQNYNVSYISYKLQGRCYYY